MRTYKTRLVNVDTNALYAALFKKKTFGDDDIIIAYAVENLTMKLTLQHELPQFYGSDGKWEESSMFRNVQWFPTDSEYSSTR